MPPQLLLALCRTWRRALSVPHAHPGAAAGPMPDIAPFVFHRSNSSKRTPGLAQKIALDIARGLQFLHQRHIVHLDLKSPNGEETAASVGNIPAGDCSHASNPLCNLLPHCRSVPNIHDLRAVLLTEDSVAKIGDVGLARFMPNDYMSQQAAIGTALPGSPASILCAEKRQQRCRAPACIEPPARAARDRGNVKGSLLCCQAPLCGRRRRC